METLYPCCAGLDVHKDTVVACVRRVSPGGQVRKQVRTFGTMTAHLLELVDWLVAEGVTHAAMESTGVYWKPVFNLLEGQVQVIRPDVGGTAERARNRRDGGADDALRLVLGHVGNLRDVGHR